MIKKKIDKKNLNWKFIKNKKKNILKERFNFDFPNDFFPNSSCENLKKFYKKIDLKVLTKTFKIAGRIVSKRIMSKKTIFFDLEDGEDSIQIYFNKNIVSLKDYEIFQNLDLGDIIGVLGTLFKTKTGELTIRCNRLFLLNKILGNFSKKFYGLTNKEICSEKRYLDLAINRDSRLLFKKRSKIIYMIRKFMFKKNFIEVETPILQSIPGGALAKPFVTYHNNLHKNMYLRIAPELYLKKLLVGGFKKVFELNKNFRNESISSAHNPEFTMMEFYIAYADYKKVMRFTEKLINNLVLNLFEDIKLKYNNYMLNFDLPFKRLSMQEAIIQYIPQINTKEELLDIKRLKNISKDLDINICKNWSINLIINEIFEKKVVKNIVQPTFITLYPLEISPLAKRNKSDPSLTDRCELFIAGYEIGNGFSELNDPNEQRTRFKKQTELNKKDYLNDKFYDEDYINALEYGLPPTGGFGLGIDRLIMLLTNKQNIRDVLLFPIR